jgi:uncharacterized protein YbjT (DUF2867 family)
MKQTGLRILLFGASGMVGQGVLRECLRDPEVTEVVTIGRTAIPIDDPKGRNIVHADLLNYSDIENELSDFDACFFCLGVTAAGLSEKEYRRISFDITLCVARVLARLNPEMVFTYVSGAGTDSTGAGRVMWARIKGQTENALLALPFNGYMMRPGIIQPLDGIRSKTPSYRLFYSVLGPLLPLLRKLLPAHILTTAQMGTAMLNLCKRGYAKRLLETRDIAAIA